MTFLELQNQSSYSLVKVMLIVPQDFGLIEKVQYLCVFRIHSLNWYSILMHAFDCYKL